MIFVQYSDMDKYLKQVYSNNRKFDMPEGKKEVRYDVPQNPQC